MRENVSLLAFNRGLCSRLGLARADIKRMSMAAETFINWMPRVLGSMMLRPGLRYIASSYGDNKARYLPFIFSTSDKAKIELTDLNMRVWIGDTVISRPTVTAAVTNPSFTANVTNWTDNDESGGASDWVTDGGAGGYMRLLGNGTAAAIRDQTVTLNQSGTEHALRIVVARGPVMLRVGSAATGDQYISETALDEGTHSLTFTPTTNIYIRLFSRLNRYVYVDSCTIESAGDMIIPTPWSETNIPYVKYDQSGDIIFAACAGIQQYKIERRGVHSWSVVKYLPEDGPFNVLNVGPITMTPSVLTGNGTITASKAYFKATDIGALFAITSSGQTVTTSFTATPQFSDPILVEGITTSRAFTIVLSGLTASGNTIILERSFDSATWVAVAGKSWTVNTTESYTDGLDNQTVYYRLSCTVYAAGTTVGTMKIATGFNRGICRITSTNTLPTVMNMEVLEAFGGIAAETDWEPGLWSDRNGWPTAVTFYEGRLWWLGKDGAIGSASDAFYTFDPTTAGDDQVINRKIGSGPVDTINWALPLQRLILGGQSAEHSCRSTSFDEPLTPTNFNIKKPSTQGSSYPSAIVVDDKGVFVQRGGTRLFELALSSDTYDYQSTDLTALFPEVGQPQIIRLVVQRQPDTRIHCLRSDGTVAMLLFDKVENVLCWLEVETTGASGFIEDILILPGDLGDEEDHVFYLVKRTINGLTKRYLEQWAFESTCKGGAVTNLADSYTHTTGQVITGLDHLEGKQVVVWADGLDVGHDANDALIYTVTGGSITLAASYTDVVVGLPYQARFKSGKLVQLKQGDALKSTKQIKGLGLIMADTHHKGLKFGSDFTTMDDLPSVEYGTAVTAGTIYADYDEYPFVFPGNWTTDDRLCLEANAPRPVTILAAICDTEYHG